VKILVFGKDGQLGNAFNALFDSLVLPSDVHIQYVGRSDCDISNGQAINNFLEQFKPSLILNAAAYTAVDKAETEVELAYAINAKAPEIMANYAAGHGATLLHYSTDYVFDGKKNGFYIESDIRNPLGVYGKSKAAGEELIEQVFERASQGQFAIFRTSWVYGDGSNFIRTILRLAKERSELNVIHDQYGIPTSAQWLAEISIDFLLNQNFHLKKFASGIYHAVPSGETTWYELALLAIGTALGAGVSLKLGVESIKPILAVEYPLPAPRPQNSRMDNAKLRLVIEDVSDVSKLHYWNQPWDEDVRSYVNQLVKNGLI